MRRLHQLMLAGLASALVIAGTGDSTAYANDPPSLEDVTLEKLKAANQANRDALRTAVLHERVSESYRQRPGEDQEARDRMTRAYLQGRDNSIESAVASGANEETLEQIRAIYDGQLSSIDDALVVWRLNKNTLVGRTSVIDFGHQRASYDDKDLRDLEKLATKHGLSENERRDNLSKTRSYILKADRNVMLVPTADLGIVRSLPRFSADLEASRLGIVPSWVFDGELELKLTIVRNEGGPYVEVIGRTPEQSVNKVLVQLRPEYGYRLTRLVTYDERGNVSNEFQASNYKPVDGAMVPFKTERRRAAYGFADYLVRQRTVESVRLNESIKADSFDIRDGYRVQDTRQPSETLKKP